MFNDFQLHHIPTLFAAASQAFGGLWPLWDAPGAMREFGFPETIATTPAASPVMSVGTARTTAIGVIMLIFYARGQYDALDTTLAVTGAWAGIVDFWEVRRSGNHGKATFRLITSGLLAVYALAVGTSERQ